MAYPPEVDVPFPAFRPCLRSTRGYGNLRQAPAKRGVPPGGAQHRAVYGCLRAAAAGAELIAGAGAAQQAAVRHAVGAALPHNVFAADGYPGGQHRPAVAGAICPKRAAEYTAGHALRLFGQRRRLLGADRHLCVEKRRLRHDPLAGRA